MCFEIVSLFHHHCVAAGIKVGLHEPYLAAYSLDVLNSLILLQKQDTPPDEREVVESRISEMLEHGILSTIVVCMREGITTTRYYACLLLKSLFSTTPKALNLIDHDTLQEIIKNLVLVSIFSRKQQSNSFCSRSNNTLMVCLVGDKHNPSATD